MSGIHANSDELEAIARLARTNPDFSLFLGVVGRRVEARNEQLILAPGDATGLELLRGRVQEGTEILRLVAQAQKHDNRQEQ